MWAELYVSWWGLYQNFPKKALQQKIAKNVWNSEEEISDVVSPPGLQRERKDPCLCCMWPGQPWERCEAWHWPVHPNWAKTRLLWIPPAAEQNTDQAVGPPRGDPPNIPTGCDCGESLDPYRDLRHCMPLAWYRAGKCRQPQKCLSNALETDRDGWMLQLAELQLGED